ncbi:MAG: hypothetical protein HFE63_07845 [Clostridiales bacterium]|nr:hypothetical protein [Clostridiales bacterium]
MGKLLRKYLGIYFLSLFCMSIFILSIYAVTDLGSRLDKLKGQDFYVKPEEVHILKVYVLDNVWNEDGTRQEKVLTDIKKGERYRVSSPVEKIERDGYVDFYPIRGNGPTYFSSDSGVMAAEYDGKLTATFSINMGMSCSKPKNGGLFGYDNYMCMEYKNDDEENTYMSRQRMQIRVDPTIRFDPNPYVQERLLLDRKYHNRTGHPTIDATYSYIRRYTNVRAHYYSMHRDTTETTVYIRAYDNVDENRVVAYAEVRVYYYSDWLLNSFGAEKEVKVSNDVLAEMWLNDEDNIAHVDVELIDYWQVEKY